MDEEGLLCDLILQHIEELGEFLDPHPLTCGRTKETLEHITIVIEFVLRGHHMLIQESCNIVQGEETLQGERKDR